MLDHVAQLVSQYGDLNLVDTTGLGHFSYVIKIYICMTSWESDAHFSRQSESSILSTKKLSYQLLLMKTIRQD